MQVATRLWVQVQLQPIFFISMFYLGIAYGAKVGLKLRLNVEYDTTKTMKSKLKSELPSV